MHECEQSEAYDGVSSAECDDGKGCFKCLLKRSRYLASLVSGGSGLVDDEYMRVLDAGRVVDEEIMRRLREQTSGEQQ